jgi:hypothetical protein
MNKKIIVAGFPPQRPGFDTRSGYVGFVVDKVALGQFSPITWVSSANSYSTDCSTLIIYRPGLEKLAKIVAGVPSGLSLTPPQKTIKIKET